MEFVKAPVLGLVVLIGAMAVYFIMQARSGKLPEIKRIEAIEAIDDAVARAAEMGRPVLSTPGHGKLGSAATMAGIAMMKYTVARCIEHEVPVIVTAGMAPVYELCDDIVRQLYTEAGKPEEYRMENVRFLGGGQFAFVSHHISIFQREHVASYIGVGDFRASSIMLGEAGNLAGTLMIGGTDTVSQQAFFAVAYDYFLLGEEIYAAGAYVTKDPDALGSIRGVDLTKIFVIALMLLGSILATVGITVLSDILK